MVFLDKLPALICIRFKHEEAMKELHRVLKTGGLFIIGQYCYLPKRSPLAKMTEDLILKFNPRWTMANGDGLYPSQGRMEIVMAQATSGSISCRWRVRFCGTVLLRP